MTDEHLNRERQSLATLSTPDLIHAIRHSVEQLLQLKPTAESPHSLTSFASRASLNRIDTSSDHSLTPSQNLQELEKQVCKYEADIRKHISIEH